jgi:multiple sugar transport system substrate-binding protein
MLSLSNLFILIFLFVLILPTPVSSQTVLRMIGPEDIEGGWGEVIARFEGNHPDITVDYFSGPWSTDERRNMYVRSFLAGDPFELIYMDVIWTAKFAEKGWILPLDQWFPPERWEEFLPGDIEAGLYKGHIYRVPVRSDVGVLYYRKDLVPVPPKTWQKFEKFCKEYSHPPERYGIVFQGMQYEGLTCNYLEYLWGAGGSVLDRQGRACLDTSENIFALGMIKRMIEEGWTPRSVVTYQEQQSLEFFQRGDTLFMRNWPYAWKILQESPLRGKVGIGPLIHRSGEKSAGTLGGWGLAIARETKNPEEAWKFIEFATSVEAQKILHIKRGAVPARRSLFKDQEILKANPHYRELYALLLSARPRPVHPDYARISASIQKNVSAVLVGIETVKEATQTMNRQIQSVVAGKKVSWLERSIIDYDLYLTLKNTALFTFLSVPLEFFLGLCFALLINVPLKVRALSRFSILIPWALPTAVMAMAWQWMFNNPFGVINDLLVRTGFLTKPLDWLATPGGAMFAAVFADVWKTTPFVAIILLAGLQSIPKELEESLSIDGAGSIMRLFHLLLPLLMPFIRVALIFRMIHAAGIFDLLWVLTKGGPADSTRTLSLYIYDLAFRYDEMSYGIFLAFFFLAGLVLMSFIIVRLTTMRYERIHR